MARPRKYDPVFNEQDTKDWERNTHGMSEDQYHEVLKEHENTGKRPSSFDDKVTGKVAALLGKGIASLFK